MQVINQMFRMAGDHEYAWDFETLRRALRAAGFSKVKRSEKGGAPDGLDIDGTDWWREVESLYVNVRR